MTKIAAVQSQPLRNDGCDKVLGTCIVTCNMYVGTIILDTCSMTRGHHNGTDIAGYVSNAKNLSLVKYGHTMSMVRTSATLPVFNFVVAGTRLLVFKNKGKERYTELKLIIKRVRALGLKVLFFTREEPLYLFTFIRLHTF
jgi:hypothetical protein